METFVNFPEDYIHLPAITLCCDTVFAPLCGSNWQIHPFLNSQIGTKQNRFKLCELDTSQVVPMLMQSSIDL